MNEQFRVAQKLGLMFLPDSPIPEDIKDPNAAFALYVYNTDLKDNVADYLLQNLKTIEPTKSDNPVDTSKYNN